jgi:hypothetical protein
MFPFNFLKYIKDKSISTHLINLTVPNTFKPELSQKHIISVDQTITNMKKVNNNYHVMDGITFDTTLSFDYPLSLQSVVSNFLQEIKSIHNKRVYSSINSTDSVVSHQNWICIDNENKELIRFEPNIEYPQFRIEELCIEICKKLSFKYRMYTNFSINPYGACRILSTVLAMCHMYNISCEYLEILQNEELIKPFIYMVQTEFPSFPQNQKKYLLRVRK